MTPMSPINIPMSSNFKTAENKGKKKGAGDPDPKIIVGKPWWLKIIPANVGWLSISCPCGAETAAAAFEKSHSKLQPFTFYINQGCHQSTATVDTQNIIL